MWAPNNLYLPSVRQICLGPVRAPLRSTSASWLTKTEPIIQLNDVEFAALWAGPRSATEYLRVAINQN